ncbi:ArsR/SmtB family transcription factor [Nocardia jiangxiensis]|uniref:ArsR/SmtB family transcription factor n=1 Tax=Nocardia jiangxiensis TaxID=282685 RepID=UPI000309B710|nr:metalloregulator ArsR/SmtB family transcription factor [Nocardia jiangxiensis]
MSRSAAQSAFEALSDPTRRRILHLLSECEETTAGALADAIAEVGRTAVSSHLRVLRNADLVIERREGRFRYYSLHPDGPMQDALGFLQSILAQGLVRSDAGEPDRDRVTEVPTPGRADEAPRDRSHRAS